MFSKQIILRMSDFDHILIQGNPLNKPVIWISADGVTVSGPIPSSGTPTPNASGGWDYYFDPTGPLLGIVMDPTKCYRVFYTVDDTPPYNTKAFSPIWNNIVICPCGNSCVTDFKYSFSSTDPNTVQVSIDSPDPLASLYNVTWGDGSGQDWYLTPHTYTAPGSYDICLKTYYVTAQLEKLYCTKCVTVCIGGGANPSTQFAPGKTGTALSNQEDIKLYPNPATREVHIEFAAAKNETANIRITDLYGKTVARAVNNTTYAGKQDVTVNTANLAPGMYHVTIDIGGKTTYKKLSVVR